MEYEIISWNINIAILFVNRDMRSIVRGNNRPNVPVGTLNGSCFLLHHCTISVGLSKMLYWLHYLSGILHYYEVYQSLIFAHR